MNSDLFRTARIFIHLFNYLFIYLFVTIQGIVNGALLSAAIIPSKTGNPFFLIVEM